jgi:carbon-monoxide dehydrogenase medium subunit
MNFRLAQPSVLIDLNRIAGLGEMREDGGTLRLGALTRHRTIERDARVARHAPLFAEAAPHVAHPQVRNRGTLGGNLSQADPASEFPAVAVALRARLKARSAGGGRWIEAHEFFAGPLATALASDELLEEIVVPAAPPRTGSAFMEIARRRGDYALAGAATVVRLDAAGRCSEARIALCGVGETPVLLDAPTQMLGGAAVSAEAIEAAAAAIDAEIDPPSNVHATAAYRRHLAKVLVRRTLSLALARAETAA